MFRNIQLLKLMTEGSTVGLLATRIKKQKGLDFRLEFSLNRMTIHPCVSVPVVSIVVPFHSQKYPGLDDKVHDHPKYNK